MQYYCFPRLLPITVYFLNSFTHNLCSCCSKNLAHKSWNQLGSALDWWWGP